MSETILCEYCGIRYQSSLDMRSGDGPHQCSEIRLCAAIRVRNERIAQLEAENAELRKDRARLVAEIAVREKRAPVTRFADFWSIGENGEPIRMTFKEAIDAAMHTTNAQGWG